MIRPSDARAIGPTHPMVERRYATILFCDLAGYTALSERLDLEDLRDVQARYQRLASRIIERWGGFVASFQWYLHQGYLELSPDEAHYWEWSRRLDWSYYSKGPFVAYLIALSTALGGATELFVRLPAVFLSAGTTVCVFGLIKALFADARLALATAMVLQMIPLFAAGALLMTIDPPLIFFWTLMLWLVYRALSEDRTTYWYAAGMALACGLLSKYAMGYVVLSLWLFLATSPRYRGWLRRKEPYVMLAIGMAGFSPVIFWNLRHGAVSLKHVMGQADVHQGLALQLSLDTFGEFLGSQALALSPLLFGWMLIAMALSLWEGLRQRDDRWLFLFWGWAPTFSLMLALSLRQKVQANWAAPAYITAFIAAMAYVVVPMAGGAGRVVEASAAGRSGPGDSAGVGDDRGVARSRPVRPSGIAAQRRSTGTSEGLADSGQGGRDARGANAQATVFAQRSLPDQQ